MYSKDNHWYTMQGVIIQPAKYVTIILKIKDINVDIGIKVLNMYKKFNPNMIKKLSSMNVKQKKGTNWNDCLEVVEKTSELKALFETLMGYKD